MGSGDWNDGMDKVGAGGKGESVWLAFFLYDVLTRFGPLAAARGDLPFYQECASQLAELKDRIETHGWDGEWYRRAYFDDGTPLGSAENNECRIDSIAQSWSVLSNAGSAEHTRMAMQRTAGVLERGDKVEIKVLLQTIAAVSIFRNMFRFEQMQPVVVEQGFLGCIAKPGKCPGR